MTGAGDRYTEIMADTKIALAPRGSSVETYRFFEAMRQGCVVICDRLPPHWFYVGCPAIQVDDWGNLEAEVRALSADPERWWICIASRWLGGTKNSPSALSPS